MPTGISLTQYIFSQIIGGIAFIFFAASFWHKNRKVVLILEVIECVFYAIHYFLINAYTGAVVNIIGMIRSWLFIYKGKNKFFSSLWLPTILILLYLLNCIFTWVGPISIIPTVAAIIFCLSIWQNNTKTIRRFGVVVLMLSFIYAFLVGTYIVVITDGILIISTIIAIIRLDIIKERKAIYTIRINVNLNQLKKIFKEYHQNLVYETSVINNPDYIKFVCLYENKPVGYLALYPHDNYMQKQDFPKLKNITDNSVFIRNIVVKKNYQRRGVATTLLNEIKKIYADYDIYSIINSKNKQSVFLFSTLNYKKIFEFKKDFNGKVEKFDVVKLSPRPLITCEEGVLKLNYKK